MAAATHPAGKEATTSTRQASSPLLKAFRPPCEGTTSPNSARAITSRGLCRSAGIGPHLSGRARVLTIRAGSSGKVVPPCCSGENAFKCSSTFRRNLVAANKKLERARASNKQLMQANEHTVARLQRQQVHNSAGNVKQSERRSAAGVPNSQKVTKTELPVPCAVIHGSM